jgi:hypothetical protein
MSYSRFLEYLDMGRVTKVGVVVGGCWHQWLGWCLLRCCKWSLSICSRNVMKGIVHAALAGLQDGSTTPMQLAA